MLMNNESREILKQSWPKVFFQNFHKEGNKNLSSSPHFMQSQELTSTKYSY